MKRELAEELNRLLHTMAHVTIDASKAKEESEMKYSAFINKLLLARQEILRVIELIDYKEEI